MMARDESLARPDDRTLIDEPLSLPLRITGLVDERTDGRAWLDPLSSASGEDGMEQTTASKSAAFGLAEEIA